MRARLGAAGGAADGLGQVPLLDDGAVAHHDGALDGVLELAHVARPRVVAEHVEGAARDAPRALAVLGGVLLDEVLRERRDVAAPVAQRRERDREDVEPVVQVFAEAAARDRGDHVLVRRGDEAHVRLQRLGAAESLELARLQDAQQLDLRRQRQLADLVEEERAALREIQAALLAADRAGERAALVAEELGLEQSLGKRRAVDLDEGLAGALRVGVDGVGDQLLARPGLAEDERRRGGARDLPDLFVDLAHRRAGPDHVRVLEAAALARLA